MQTLPVNYTSVVLNKIQKRNTNIQRPNLIPLMSNDTVSFKGTPYLLEDLNVDYDTAIKVKNSLSDSTSGHRAYYGEKGGKYFNEDIVKYLTVGVADYVKSKAQKENKEKPTVLIGGDARKATYDLLPSVEEVLKNQGVNVLNIKYAVPTPVLAVFAKEYNVDLAVLMTASHNPWEDGGYNLVTNKAAIATSDITQEVAKNAQSYASQSENITHYKKYTKDFGKVQNIDPYKTYKHYLEDTNLIDFENIKRSGLYIYYDALSGAGHNVLPKLVKEEKGSITEIDSGKKQVGPNPTKENLKLLETILKYSTDELAIGIATDGDADRFGIVDENGNFVSTNDVLLLATYHLAKNKGLKGAIIRNQGTSAALDEIAKKYDLDLIETPIGFKFIGEEILSLREQNKDILIAGEESGGLTAQGCIPEKDGILATLLIADLVAKEQKPLSKILKEVKSELNNQYYMESYNLKVKDNKQRDEVMAKAVKIYNSLDENKENTIFGDDFVIDVKATKEHFEKMCEYKKGGDGVKLYFKNGATLLIRKSGTEPLVRFYSEAKSEDVSKAVVNAKTLVENAKNVLLN